MRARGRLRFLIAPFALLVLGAGISCKHPQNTINPPCREGNKCAQSTPHETEEQAWAHAEQAMADGVHRVRVTCGNELTAEYDKETWKDAASPRDPDVPVFRLAENDVANALKELEQTCDETRWIKFMVVRYVKDGAPAVLSSDGVLEINIDPTSGKSDPYYLRRQFGWKWK